MTAAVGVSGRARTAAAAAYAAFVLATGVTALLTFGPAHVQSGADFAVTTAALLPAVLTGGLVAWRVPESPVGAALTWVGAAPALVVAVETWGTSLTSPHPWPGATAMFVLKSGAWVWNLSGFVALCLVFPDGRLPGRAAHRLPWIGLTAALVLTAALALDPSAHRLPDGRRVGLTIEPPDALRSAVLVVAFGGVLATLLAVAATVVLRIRRADGIARRQLRWLVVGAGTVPVLLGAGWVAGLAGVPQDVWVPAFFVTMITVMPAAVAVAILRYDLYDVDRLLGSTLAVFLTSVVSAGVFAAIVGVTAPAVGRNSTAGVTGAAFGTALCLLPTYRVIHRRVGSVFDRERTWMRAQVTDFVTRVRDGRAEPEAVEDVLRSALGDDALRLLVRLPGTPAHSYVDMTGAPFSSPDPDVIPLQANGSDVAAILLGHPSTRRRRQARELALLARLPIEVSRLRLELRLALRDVQATQARLMIAVAEERRRLERDLHDGAQQQVVALGMRLRSIQRRIDTTHPAQAELDRAVEMIETTVAELRTLAHGVRPGRLQDGLRAAMQDLLADSPIPVSLEVDDLDVPEVVATTCYFVLAECVTNTYKHAQATRLSVRVAAGNGSVRITIRDDGAGGATPAFGLTSVRDRVAALGGRIDIDSPAAAGTTIRAELPCVS